MAFHMPTKKELPTLRASFPPPMSRQASSPVEQVQLQVASRFGGGAVALAAARKVLEMHTMQIDNAESLPKATSSIQRSGRQHQTSQIKEMFKFKGDFEPPDNAEFPTADSHIGVHRPAAMASGDTQQPDAPAESSAVQFSKPPTDSSNQGLPAEVSHPPTASSPVPNSSAAIRKPQHESDFRRSHSPEWYDAQFRSYVLRQHKENVPDWRYSQAMADGPQSPVRQSLFSFGKLHPALADKHYLRTSDESERILDAKLRLQHKLEQQHLARSHLVRPATAGGIGSKRSPDKGWAALRQDADALRQESQQVTQRASEVIAASTAASARLRAGSGVSRRPNSAPYPRVTSRLTTAEQLHIASLEAQIAQLQQNVQDLSQVHGHEAQHRDTATVDDSQQQQLNAEESAIADILTIARSPVFDTVYSKQARRTLADHLVDDFNTGDRQQQEDQQEDAEAGIYLTEEEEMRVASAAFDELRWEEWDAATSAAMQRRGQQGQERSGSPELGYASDLEQQEQDTLADRNKGSTNGSQSNEVTWRSEDDWMDEYRDAASRSPQPPHERSGRGALQEQDEALLQQAYVPILYEDLVGNPGAIGRLASPRGPRRGKLQQPFSPTSPKPMAFELRAQTRPKTIMQVKMEQDLAMRQAEEEAMRHYQFKANPLPKSTTEPRLENIRKQHALKLKHSHERNLCLLKSQERPFSFYGKALAKEEALKQYKPPTAKDFQQTFKANPIPKSYLEVRLAEIEAERAAKKLAAHKAAEQKLKEAAMPLRMQMAADRLKAKAAQPSPAQAGKGSKGAMQQGRAVGRRSPVPDFKRLHAAWESRLADTKAANRATATKPEDLHTGSCTPEEVEARKQVAKRRHARDMAQAAAYEEQRIETRWPYVSPSKKVSPTKPPARASPMRLSTPTKSQQLRDAAIKAFMQQSCPDMPQATQLQTPCNRDASNAATQQSWVVSDALFGESRHEYMHDYTGQVPRMAGLARWAEEAEGITFDDKQSDMQKQHRAARSQHE